MDNQRSNTEAFHKLLRPEGALPVMKKEECPASRHVSEYFFKGLLTIEAR